MSHNLLKLSCQQPGLNCLEAWPCDLTQRFIWEHSNSLLFSCNYMREKEILEVMLELFRNEDKSVDFV